MIKMITAASILMIILLFTGGCSSKEERVESIESIEKSTVIKRPLNQKELRQAIMAGGKDAGWRMTEFKSNAVIAESLDEDFSLTVTIYFDNKGFYFMPEGNIPDLSDAIKKRLEEE